MSKRLAMLEKLAQSGNADSFARYALALEYKGLGRVDDSLATFEALRAADEAYVPMYLMCGSMLLEAGRPDQATTWLERGIVVATRAGDAKALGELGDALARAR